MIPPELDYHSPSSVAEAIKPLGDPAISIALDARFVIEGPKGIPRVAQELRSTSSGRSGKQAQPERIGVRRAFGKAR